MPRGDGTGPAGMGPMTGRAAGYCAGYATPGFTNPAFGRGGGWCNWANFTGMPRWARWGMGPYYQSGINAANFAQYKPIDEEAALRAEADYLRANLEAIEKRLSQLENQDDVNS